NQRRRMIGFARSSIQTDEECLVPAASRLSARLQTLARCMNAQHVHDRPKLRALREVAIDRHGAGRTLSPQILADRAAEAETLSLDPRYPKYFTSAVHLPTGWL